MAGSAAEAKPLQLIEGERTEEADGVSAQEFLLNMGPQHPSTHGVLRLVVRLDGEVVREVIPHLGYIHRSIEKIAENETYPQITHLTDRLDYLSAHANNWCWVRVVEQGLGIQVPERAELVRIIICELQRIQSHLLWWGVFGMDLGAFTPFLHGFRDREELTDIFEETCGARLTMNYFRIGGLVWDLHENFIPRVKKFLGEFPRTLEEYHALVTNNPIIRERCEGIGVLSGPDAVRYGCTGQVLRASGIPYDVRQAKPYGLYSRFSFTVPCGVRGDCYDRYIIRLQEIEQSMSIVKQALEMLEPGPCLGAMPRKIALPAGTYWSSVETARGEFGCFVESTGGDKPYRVKLRSPGFSNLYALDALARGHKVADLVTILSTLDLVIPDIDR